MYSLQGSCSNILGMILLKTVSELGFFFLLFIFLIEVMIYNVLLISNVQQSDSVTKLNLYICIYSLINITFHYGLITRH